MPDAPYKDDPTIPDHAELWRRIPPRHFFLDENEGRWRPSSAAFDDVEMSVALAEVVVTASGGPETVLAGHPGYALAALSAGRARECDQAVARDPLPDEPAHAIVYGRKSKSIRVRFARECVWVVPPA